jgi:hypothetical protein
MSIGETLARACQDAGLSITQISQQTRIRETVIRGIEHDDFTPCGGDFYARGHIRNVAAMVGADAVPLIQEYDAAHGGTRQASAAETLGPGAPPRLPRAPPGELERRDRAGHCRGRHLRGSPRLWAPVA